MSERPLRVMLTADAVGGVWQYVTDLARALRAETIEPIIVLLGPPPSPAQQACADDLRVIATGLPLDWLCADAAPILAASETIAALAASEEVDCIQLNMPTLGARATFPVPVVAVTHGCVSTWWEAAQECPLGADYLWHRKLMAAALRAADQVVAPTAAYGANIARHYDLEHAPLTVHNGRRFLTIASDPAMPDHAFTAGRLWDRVKNANVLDRIASRLSVPFLAAGPVEGPHGETIRLDALHLLGTLSEESVMERLASRPVFVSAARFKPFGLAVLEAASAGCALVLSDIPTFRELWDGAATFVPADDDRAFAHAIEGIIGDRSRRISLGEAAQARAGRYTPAATAAAMAGVYRRLVSRACRRQAGGGMRIVYFTHSLASCWNHGNAHFLRGIVSELMVRGHDVQVFEPRANWSLENLLADHGPAGLDAYHAAYPELRSDLFDPAEDVAPLLDGADLVIVHEWNDPALIAAIGRERAHGGEFTLFFHDTHHRAVSAPHEMQAFDLERYDGVLAFGEALSEVYRGWGWAGRVWTWHEAADLRRFFPPAQETERHGLVWIGNWGDGERTQELEDYLFRPARDAALPLDIYGVRYPEAARATLAGYGATYHGWAPNARAPTIFARHIATVHVPRRYYATILPGIPTIRVFEALACGLPLVSAPWEDSEHLFRPGRDYLIARNGEEMTRHLAALRDDPDLRASLAASGLETIRARHSCAHRVDELLSIVTSLGQPETIRSVG